MVIYTPENLGSMLVFRGCMICEHKLNKTPWHIPQTTNPTMRGHRCTVQVTHAQCQPSQSRLFLRIGKNMHREQLERCCCFILQVSTTTPHFFKNKTVKLLTFERNGFLGCIYSKRFVHSESTFVTPACGGWSSESQHLTGPSHCRGVSTLENERMSTLKVDYFNRKMHLPTIDFHGWHVSFWGGAIYTEFIENQHVEDVWIPLDQLLIKSPFLCMAAFLVLNHLFFHTQLAAENLVKTELFVHPISERNFPEVSARKFLQTWSRWTLFFQPKQWTKLGLFHPEIRGVMGQT